MAVGISVDSRYSHAAWAAALGGISLPLLSDFHPKGAVADSFGLYLADKGITDRATVLVDAAGKVRYVNSVTPSGQRDIEALVARAEALDSIWTGPKLQSPVPESPGLPDGGVLYVRDSCMFSRWALYARANLHLQDQLPVRNVSQDADALAELTTVGGKGQAPALRVGDRVMYESDDIASYLTGRCGRT
jgi:hypothetical protein